MTADDQIEQAISAALGRLTEGLHAEVRAMVADLAREATVDRDMAVATAREEAAASAAAALDAAVADERAKLAAAVEAAHAEERARVNAAEEASHESQVEAGGLVESLRGEAEEALKAARAEAAEALDAAHAEADRRLEEVRAEAARAQAAADAEVARLSQELAAAAAGASSRPAWGDDDAETEARAEERQADLACAERLIEAIRLADSARSLSDVLAALVDYSRGEAGRAALLLVQGDSLAAWRAVGFDADSPVGQGFSVPKAEGGVLTEALRTGAPATAKPGAGGPFAAGLAPGRVGLAVPLAVGGETVAVLYVDEGQSESSRHPSGWPEMVEALTRHAGRCLDLLTLGRLVSRQPAGVLAQHDALAVPPDLVSAEPNQQAARRHARLVIAEIRLYNEQAVTEGKRAHDLRSRLATEITRARRLYEARIPATVPDRDGVFEGELVRTLADGDPDALGQNE